MKKYFVLLLIMVIAIALYFVYENITYNPLKAYDINKLFVNVENIKKTCSIDFLGFNAKGEFFEVYKYKMNNASMDTNFASFKTWENTEVPDDAIFGKWNNCPLDSMDDKLYQFALTANNFEEEACAESLNKELKDPDNYYCYIYFNELQHYFLLYSTAEKSLYYIRKKGF